MATSITGQGIAAYKAPDDALSSESKNAVQNKVIDEELSDVKNAISQKAPLIINTASGDIASFADGADGMQIRKIVGTIVPQQSGTGDPSPDNVRPISGWTGANIEQSGKNYFNDEIINGSFNADGSFADATNRVRTRYGVRVSAGNYVINNNEDFDVVVWVFTTNNVAVADESFVEWHESPFTFNIVGDRLVKFAWRRKNNANLVPSDISGITLYDNRTTLPINWQTEAGTIYGGTVTLNEDKSVDVYVPISGYHIMPSQWSWRSTAAAWTIERSGLTPLYKDFTGGDGVVRPLACDKYKPYTYNYQANYSIAVMTYGAKRLVCKTDGTDTVTPEECTVLLELETPLTYHFDNIGQLYTYLGTNNVWIDAGSITECDYPADTKLYIDGLTAPDEDMIADGLIASGKYFTVNNQLYLSTAQIAAGAQIIPGSNCTATNIVEALNALNT